MSLEDASPPPVDLLRDIVERPTPALQGSDRPLRRPVRVASSTHAFPHYDPTAKGGPSRYAARPTSVESPSLPKALSCSSSAAAVPSDVADERTSATPPPSTVCAGSEERIVVEDLVRLQMSCFRPRSDDDGDRGSSAVRLGVDVQRALLAHRSGTEARVSCGDAPAAMHDVDFVNLVVKCLRSSVWQHRLSALEVLLRELTTDDDDGGDGSKKQMQQQSTVSSSVAAAKMLRDYFLFGPDCALRMRALVAGLAHSNPRELLCRLLVLWLLLRDCCEGVPHAITDLGSAPQEEDEEEGEASTRAAIVESNGDADDVSEMLRTNLPRALGGELALAKTLLQNLAPLSTLVPVLMEIPHARCAFDASSSSTTGGSSTDDRWVLIQTLFWGILTVGATEEDKGGNDGAGLDTWLRWPSLESELLLAFQRAIIDNAPLGSVVPVLLFLRRACQFRRPCLHLAPLIRPLLLLLLHRLAGNDPAKSTDESFRVHVLTWAVLRHMLRHGCNGVVEEFAEVLIRGTSCGSLAVVEASLLADLETDVGAAPRSLSNDKDRLTRECALSALRFVSQYESHEIWPASDAHATEELWDWRSLRVTTALHYLATYAAVSSSRVLLLVGSAARTQEHIQRLIATKLIGPEALGSYFPTLLGACYRDREDSTNSHSRARAVSLAAALRVGQTYALTRWLCSAAAAMPACRVVVAGFLASVLAKLVDAGLSTRPLLLSVTSGQLCVEELSTALEALAFLHSQHDATMIVSGRVLLLASAMTLQWMSTSRLCLSAAALAATVLVAQVRHHTQGKAGAAQSSGGSSNEEESQRAVARIVAAVRGDNAAAQTETVPHSSAGWLSRVVSTEDALLWSNLVERILATNQDTKYFFAWERLLVDALLWSVRFPMDGAVSGGLASLLYVLHDEALLPLDAGRALCMSLASWAQPERGVVFRVEATAILSLLLLTSPPPTCIAVVRVLGATNATFDETVVWAEKSARDAHGRCARLFTAESLSALHDRRRRAMLLQHDAFATVHPRSGSSWWWSAQDVLEFLDASSGPLRRWHRAAWPSVSTRSLLRCLCVDDGGNAPGEGGAPNSSSFLRSPWTAFEAEAIAKSCPHEVFRDDAVSPVVTATITSYAAGDHDDEVDTGNGGWVGDDVQDEFEF